MSKLYVKNRFGITPNNLLNHASLSFKAKGLFGYLQSKPDGWAFSIDRIKNQTKDGKSAIAAGLQELEQIGYLRRSAAKSDNGQWAGTKYTLTDSPLTENPLAENLCDLSKKDIVSRKEPIRTIQEYQNDLKSPYSTPAEERQKRLQEIGAQSCQKARE